MKAIKFNIDGPILFEMQPYIDNRGSFSRQFCKNELLQYGINFDIKQCNISKNNYKGTLRGLHYQLGNFPESKIVTCISGKIYDVIVDIRKDSPTYLQWLSVELSEFNNNILYIPHGFAHGFQTLVDNSIVYYQLNEFFHIECYNGLRWNDPKLNITWPEYNNIIINERDNSYQLL